MKVQVCGLKLVLIDPTLGLHLPLLKLVVANLATMLCYMPDTEVSVISHNFSYEYNYNLLSNDICICICIVIYVQL